MYKITDYLTEDGADPFKDWLADLSDRQARARVAVRVQHMASDNFGDHKPLTEGVCELRIDYGPGYRVYYARVGDKMLFFPIGGNKRKQQADIDTAVAYLKDWKRRTHND